MPPRITTLIFDLSEVLIAGLFGIEKPLAALLNVPEEQILPAFAGERLWSLCCGDLSEEEYLGQIIRQQQWRVDPGEVRRIIQQNFHRPVPGMAALLERLSGRYPLVLLSDHAREWTGYILDIHPFLGLFEAKFFSYELKSTKRSPDTFRRVLQMLDRPPGECLFIDDSAANIAAAAACGLHCVQFRSAADLADRLLFYGINVTTSTLSY